MKITRIKYTKEDGVYTSEPVLCVNETYQVIIANSNFKIVNSNNYEKVVGQATTPSAAKKKARNELKRMGANFYDEIRTPKKK